ncbi:hypothetical protein EMGBS15_16340 [Filimonas sp.]|nr:hypothetical protein EMGBS15_16340 [Filimonas sp.]
MNQKSLKYSYRKVFCVFEQTLRNKTFLSLNHQEYLSLIRISAFLKNPYRKDSNLNTGC